MEAFCRPLEEFEEARDADFQHRLDRKTIKINRGQSIRKTFSRGLFELIIDHYKPNGQYNREEVKKVLEEFADSNKANKYCGCQATTVYNFIDRFLKKGTPKNVSDIDQTRFKIPDCLPYKGQVFVYNKSNKLFLPVEDIYATGIAQMGFIHHAVTAPQFGEKLADHMDKYFEVRKETVKLIAKSAAATTSTGNVSKLSAMLENHASEIQTLRKELTELKQKAANGNGPCQVEASVPETEPSENPTGDEENVFVPLTTTPITHDEL